MVKKLTVRWFWSGREWFVRIPCRHLSQYDEDGVPLNYEGTPIKPGTVLVAYDDLCDAFPGLKDIATPL